MVKSKKNMFFGSIEFSRIGHCQNQNLLQELILGNFVR